MRKLMFGITAMMLVAAVAAAACGGGKKKSFTVTGDNGQKVNVSTSDKLPSDFPKDLPIYPGADYKGGVTSTQEGTTGFYASWETGDSVDKVKSWYEDELKDNDSWKSSGTFSSGDTYTNSLERKDGAKKIALITVSGDSGKTVIGAFYGDNPDASGEPTSSSDEATPEEEATSSSSASDTPQANASLPDEVSLPSDYPDDRVPLPSGARVTSASSFSSGGAKTYAIELYVKGSPKSVSDYYKGELPKHNWTEALTSESDGGFFLSYSTGSDSDTPESATISAEASDVSGYARVSLLVNVKE